MAPDVPPDEEVTTVGRSVKRCPECGQSYSPDSMFCPFDGASLEDKTWVPPTDPTVDPVLKTVVDGRYRVQSVLGEGGAGTVYKVLHETLSRTYAMKVLRRDVATDPALAARFIQEARTTASLKHPHVVAITDFGHLPDRAPYYVMEHLTGQTLAYACKTSGKLPVPRAVRIIIQVASALAAAHEAGIIHRDLKPENLFLFRRPNDPETADDDVRVVDFGAAKIAGSRRITKTGIVFGTPHYMAPEQASGQPVDHRADIYALGVIMYQVLAGRLPFEADTLMGVLTQHMFAEQARFADENDASEDGKLLFALETITFRAMAKKPEHRFQTMASLGNELERAVTVGPDGQVALAPGWRLAPRRRSGAPPSMPPPPQRRQGSGPSLASGDIAVLPRASYRGVAAVGLGVGALAVLAVTLAFARSAPSAVVQSAASSALPPFPPLPEPPPSAIPVPPVPTLSSVHVITTPSFAEVWQAGRRVGTTPMDLPVDPSSPAQYAIRAPGYAERSLLIDPRTPPSLDLTLDRLTPAPSPHARQAANPSHHTSSNGELVDPFAR